MSHDHLESNALETESIINNNLVVKVSPFLRTAGYEVLHPIGAGAFGIVLLARKISTGQEVAIKCLKIKNDHNKLIQCINEAEVMRQIESEYIVRFLDLRSDLAKGRFFLIMEYCPEGNLDTYIQSNPDISNELVVSLATKILKGLRELHNKRVIHGDLKPENILLTRQKNGDLTVKLGDFGMAKALSADQYYISNKGGSLQYLPIEALNGKRVLESDYYSVGLIIYKLCGQDDSQEIWNMKLGKFPDCAGKKHQSVLKIAFSMMSEDPKKRAGPEKVLRGLDAITDQANQEIKKKEKNTQQQKRNRSISVFWFFLAFIGLFKAISYNIVNYCQQKRSRQSRRH